MFWEIIVGLLILIGFVWGVGAIIIKLSDWISMAWFEYKTRSAFKWAQKHKEHDE